MFQSARLKLTAWYLIIIMFISVCFSAVIYNVWITEVERFAAIQRTRIERRLYGTRITMNWAVPIDDLVAETKGRIFLFLASVNGGILLVAGGLGYVLAGRTMQPIQQMVDEQNRFISDASHELKTPLTSLKTAIEVSLRDQALTLPQAKQLMHESIDEVDKLHTLSEGLLQLAQYQLPAGKISFEKIQVSAIITQATRTVQSLAVKKEITISIVQEPLTIEGNAFGLIDLLVLILDNAIKYSPENTTINLTAKKINSMATIQIQDQGIGIAKKDIPHIFDRFYRADDARIRAGKGGYGLGLSIAKKIVDTHKGTIAVKSAAKKGTLFIINLPFKQTSPQPTIFS